MVDRYPGWTPGLCREHRDTGRVSTKKRSRGTSGTRGSLLTPAQVLETFTDGPDDGVFTDGSAVPNPGPGGWGAVYVVGGSIVAEASGHDPDTTNNRMELTALIEGARLVPVGTKATVYSDSRLAVQTVTEWAPGWQRRGWRRKSGPVQNLDLVKVAFRLFGERPELDLTWIAAHSGARWNEYADALAGAWRIEE